ncbi:hypothetical protein JCM11251_002131 [Rhodosporidiobolus azoricus]
MPPRASTSGAAAGAAGSAAASKKLTALEKKLLEIGTAAPRGEITQNDLFSTSGLSITAATQDAVNSLLRKNLLQMLRTSDGRILFRFLAKEEAKAMGTMDSEEKLVLDRIKEAGNMGIWTKTLTGQTGLPRTTITKALKVLEGKKAIKTVKSVKTPTRKIYMLAGIQPSVELTGGPWFTDNELDTELVDHLKKVAAKYLATRSVPSSTTITDPSGSSHKFRPIFPVSATPFLPTVQDVLDYIIGLEVAVVELLPEHVEALLDLMVYDGAVEKVFVRRDEDGPYSGGGAALKDKANGKKAKGKGKAEKKSSSSKRKKAADSSGSESESEDDKRRSKKGKKGSSSKRAPNGKAKKKRLKFGSDAEDSDEDGSESSASEDFDSDEEAPNAKKKRKGGSDEEDGHASDELNGSDDESPRKKKGSSKRRKKRDRTKKRIKRTSSDEEEDSSASEDEKNGAGSKGKNGADEADQEDGEAAAPSLSQYVYRLIRPYEPIIGWTDMPCGRCPVEEFCAEPPRMRAVSYKRPAQVAANPINPDEVLPSIATGIAPKVRIELEGGIQGVGMLGGAGAAIGVSLAKWGEMNGAVGSGVAPINPKDCPYFKDWLDF